MGTDGVQITLLHGVKKPGCEGDHSHPDSAQVKIHGAVPLLPCVRMACRKATLTFTCKKR